MEATEPDGSEDTFPSIFGQAHPASKSISPRLLASVMARSICRYGRVSSLGEPKAFGPGYLSTGLSKLFKDTAGAPRGT